MSSPEEKAKKQQRLQNQAKKESKGAYKNMKGKC